MTSRASYAPQSLSQHQHGRRMRESMYPVPSPDFLNSLEDCVSATESCSAKMASAIAALEPGTSDLPRLTKIFKNVHYYLLLPAPSVAAHKAAYSASLAPQIDTLITRAETLVENERVKVERLEDRLAAIQSAKLPRLGAGPKHPKTFANLSSSISSSMSSGSPRGNATGKPTQDTRAQLEGLDMKELNPAQRRRVALLKNKRERLERERERLTGT